MLANFESVLEGNTEKVYHFAILAASDFELRHTKPGLRKIGLKGTMEGTQRIGPYGLRIRWWTDFVVFEAYCKDLKHIFGFDYSKEPTTKVYKPYQTPTARLDTDIRSYHAVQQDEQSRSSKGKLFMTQNATNDKAPIEHRHRVYILQAANGNALRRVGYRPDADVRLRKHNRELAGGAADTKGVIWEIYAMYTCFNDESHALSFETATQLPCNSVSHYSGRITVAESLMKVVKYQFVHLDTKHYSYLPLTFGSIESMGGPGSSSSSLRSSRVVRFKTEKHRAAPYS